MTHAATLVEVDLYAFWCQIDVPRPRWYQIDKLSMVSWLVHGVARVRPQVASVQASIRRWELAAAALKVEKMGKG